ncbi:MAG: hypothetical protein GXP48_08095 [Acidobacteria bacterium]|nr:hypothetical protein [Acidobacteriota bacterium]
MSVPRGFLGLVICLVIAGTLWASLSRDPWDPDETRYLEVTREMIRSGNPFFLRFNGDAYTDKPPLFFWTLAPFVLLFGADSAFAGMLPSLLAWLLLGLATRRIARAGRLPLGVIEWAPPMVMTALLPALLAGGCRMDMLFALWCALALERLVRLADPREAPRAHHLYFWLWIALGIMTKGPLALVFPLLSLVFLGRNGWFTFKRVLRGWGPALALVIVGAWLGPAALTGGKAWLDTIVIHQSAGRIASSFAHQAPWWYHLATIPLTLMPWSLLVLAGMIAAFSRFQTLGAGARLIAVYPFAGLIFLSVLSGKTFLYPLPLFPAACIVAAWWLIGSPEHTAQRVVLGLSGTLPVVLGLGIIFIIGPMPDMALAPWQRLLAGGVLVLPVLASIMAVLLGRIKAATALLALTIPLFVFAGLPQIVPPFNRLLSLSPFAAPYAAADTAPSKPGLAYGRFEPGFVLYSDRPFTVLKTVPQLADALASGRAVAINIKTAHRIQRETGLRWAVAAVVPYRHTKILIIRRHSEPM